MDQLIFLIILLGVGYTVGTIAEKRHYKSIEKRENKFLKLPVVTMKDAFDKNSPILRTRLVQGSAVISIDYFKRMLAALRNIVGGKVKSYETLVDRARREATLRMKKMAWDADIILNLRIETSAIGNSANRRKAIGSIEAIAYGTAITYKK